MSRFTFYTQASRATQWIVETAEAHMVGAKVVTNDPNTAVLLGLRKQAQPFTPIVDLIEEADFENRVSYVQMKFGAAPMIANALNCLA